MPGANWGAEWRKVEALCQTRSTFRERAIRTQAPEALRPLEIRVHSRLDQTLPRVLSFSAHIDFVRRNQASLAVLELLAPASMIDASDAAAVRYSLNALAAASILFSALATYLSPSNTSTMETHVTNTKGQNVQRICRSANHASSQSICPVEWAAPKTTKKNATPTMTSENLRSHPAP